jgi:flagellin-like hook-associated protein FlgL
VRITSQMAFNNLVSSVQNNLNTYTTTQMLISSNERISKPSDDPTGYYRANALGSQSSAIDQYLASLKEADTCLTATDSALGDLNDLLTQARQIAEQQATETSSAEDRALAADEVQQLLAQAISLANSDVSGRYLFGGYQTDDSAYSDVGLILPPYADADNTYTGTASASGSYTGTENKSYLVRIVSAGAVGTAQYQVSEDGGTTWGSTMTVQSGDNSIFDDQHGTDSGVRLAFTDGTFAEGDEFKVEIGAGTYQGDDGKIEVNIGRNTRIATNITGREAFEDTNLFTSLNQLYYALKHNSTSDIANSLDNVESTQTKLQSAVVKVGNQLSRAETAASSLTVMKENLSSAISELTEPDSINALTQLAMQESALSSSTSMLAKILPENLFNYL